eukprot:6468726-Amphidinium_carterae.1
MQMDRVGCWDLFFEGSRIVLTTKSLSCRNTSSTAGRRPSALTSTLADQKTRYAAPNGSRIAMPASQSDNPARSSSLVTSMCQHKRESLREYSNVRLRFLEGEDYRAFCPGP